MPMTSTALRDETRGETPQSFEVGRCRALRQGSHIWVTGSAPERADGRVYRPGDPEAQAERCLDVIEQALKGVDASLRDVVRTAVFIADPCSWMAVRKALAARFAGHPPVLDVVEITTLPDPHMLVEIEAEAFVSP
jgi:isochorismate pyruvate lyase